MSRGLPFDPVLRARDLWAEHGWSSAADGMAAVTSLMRAQQVVAARTAEALRPTGLTFARYELLMLLLFSREGRLSMGKASARLQVHPTSVTNAVDRLAAAGLVERAPHPTDGRATLVVLTEQGRTTALRATELLNEQVFAVPGLAPERVHELVDVLTDLRRTAGDFEA